MVGTRMNAEDRGGFRMGWARRGGRICPAERLFDGLRMIHDASRITPFDFKYTATSVNVMRILSNETIHSTLFP